ncbi:phosphotransferase [Virgibacillus kekensis]|uniref:Phosphotransferase n=1 Tax=Virgibacillus kekensis TaxID=202261 RepID=A0ABV9DKT4_9BACI
MINPKQGDEMNYHRLSSFLSSEGKLGLQQLSPINRNVYYLETESGESLILKKHRNKSRMLQQWDFFEQFNSSMAVPFCRFPNGQKYLLTEGRYWTVSRYQSGNKLNYNDERDRVSAVDTLRMFHNEALGIKIPTPGRKEKFYLRWYDRLESFKKTDVVFVKHGFETLFKDIVQTSESTLRFISRFPWVRVEEEAKHIGRWIHGDVASHNFIRGEKKVYLIDFDLLNNAPPLYDYMQLGQRFLPYIDWDLERLLAYHMVHRKYLKAWLAVILVPSDIMREWLHFLYGEANKTPEEYLYKMERNWERRKTFSKSAKKVLKS